MVNPGPSTGSQPTFAEGVVSEGVTRVTGMKRGDT